MCVFEPESTGDGTVPVLLLLLLLMLLLLMLLLLLLVVCLPHSPPHQLLATGSIDGSIHVWVRGPL